MSKWSKYPSIHLTPAASAAIEARIARLGGTRAGMANKMIEEIEQAYKESLKPKATLKLVKRIVAGAPRHRQPTDEEKARLDSVADSDMAAMVVLMTLDGEARPMIKQVTGKSDYFQRVTMLRWDAGKFWGVS